MICRCFEPIAAPDARALIVGSMPSVRSLAAGEYYAHPRNAFWPMLFELFGEEPSGDYARKRELILSHHLALWDAAALCEREGSLDSDMKDAVLNDFAPLYARCPGIKAALCNGGTAYSLFLRSGAAGVSRALRLPSTSPAYTLPYARKREAWGEALREAGIL